MPITLNTKPYGFAGFTPASISQYFNRPAGPATGFSPLTVRVEDGKADQKIRWKLKVPVVATGDSACSCEGSVLRTDFVDIVVTVSKSSTAAERADLALRIKDLAASTEFQSSISNLVQPSA